MFYRNGDEVIGVEIEEWQVMSFGNPKILFRGNYNSCDDQNYATIGMWDITSDGKRFLMIKPTSAKEDAPRKINIVLNWFEELKQKVPADQKSLLPDH